MMDAQGVRRGICILFLWKQVQAGGLWEWCASSPAGSGNGGPRSCRVGGCKSGCVTLAPCRCNVSIYGQTGVVCSSIKVGHRRVECAGAGGVVMVCRVLGS